jgi:hypothetical protein
MQPIAISASMKKPEKQILDEWATMLAGAKFAISCNRPLPQHFTIVEMDKYIKRLKAGCDSRNQ